MGTPPPSLEKKLIAAYIYSILKENSKKFGYGHPKWNSSFFPLAKFIRRTSPFTAVHILYKNVHILYKTVHILYKTVQQGRNVRRTPFLTLMVSVTIKYFSRC